MAQICEEGYKLNVNKDRCIPIPGSYVPFPLIIACLLLAILAYVSEVKIRSSLAVTNVIAFISIIEFVGILVLVVTARNIGLKSTFGLALAGLLFLLGANLFFGLIYRLQILSDPSLKYWSINYKNTQIIITVVSGLINFKFYRMIYGRFFGLDNFHAPFD